MLVDGIALWQNPMQKSAVELLVIILSWKEQKKKKSH